MHGGQKLLVFSGRKYVGQYALSPPPYATATVKGMRVILQVDGTRETVTLDFSRRPPRDVFINGETEEFYR